MLSALPNPTVFLLWLLLQPAGLIPENAAAQLDEDAAQRELRKGIQSTMIYVGVVAGVAVVLVGGALFALDRANRSARERENKAQKPADASEAAATDRAVAAWMASRCNQPPPTDDPGQ
jgi:hypothetical protein